MGLRAQGFQGRGPLALVRAKARRYPERICIREEPMRRTYVWAGVFGLIVTVAAVAADMPPLRGDRFKPLKLEEMTAEQKVVVDSIMSGPRGSMNGLGGPFNALLRSPDLGDRVQKVGEYVRFKTSLPQHLNEMAILITARHWTSQYEWYAHHALAMKAGLNPAVADDISAGRRPAAMQPDEAIVYDFSRELLDTKQVSDARFDAVKARFGERGVIDLVGVLGYYTMVSMLLNVDRYPLPDGAKSEIQKPM
jgi:4-carboxymuconolactone decarboxylase